MTSYLVTMQTDGAAQPHRAGRGDQRGKPVTVSVEATSCGAAEQIATDGSPAAALRVVAVEECPPPLPAYTDDDLTRALTDGPNPLDPADYASFGYTSPDFEWQLRPIAHQLATSGLLPGLTLSLDTPEGYSCPTYLMVEIFDHADGRYRSRGCDPRHVCDRDAVGWDAVLQAARTLLLLGHLCA